MDKNEIVISRVFDAPRQAVWEAWTTPEMVKKWWGPKDFYAPSIKIDLRVGGKYVFAMHGPKGSEWDKDMYSAGEYREIVPEEKLVVTDYFSDKEGNRMDPQTYGMPSDMPDEMKVTVKFEEVPSPGGERTRLSIIYPDLTEEQREAMLKTGMEDGWNTSLDKLAETLEKS